MAINCCMRGTYSNHKGGHAGHLRRGESLLGEIGMAHVSYPTPSSVLPEPRHLTLHSPARTYM